MTDMLSNYLESLRNVDKVKAEDMIDYVVLLKKYMQHVGESEGSTFMHTIHDRTRSDVKFTDEEVRVLEEMDEGVGND